jgi:hypothetical protein
MVEVTLRFTSDDAYVIACFLRSRYAKDKRTSLARLCEISVRREVARQAKVELVRTEALSSKGK